MWLFKPADHSWSSKTDPFTVPIRPVATSTHPSLTQNNLFCGVNIRAVPHSATRPGDKHLPTLARTDLSINICLAIQACECRQ